ncbi:hypothetical protein [uncultured Campylobacter sp.]|uniref:hypothetical protein n=1 Tax=uncultured Campylobacter sp. TaxID=218934 RepID=UPI002628A3C5|nr:hypothetical protein [uncultured Campylobacter sp.]
MHITIAYHGYDGSSLHTPFKKGLKDQSKEFNDLIVKKLEEKGIAVEYQRPKSKLTDELKRELTFVAYTNEGEMIVLAKDKSTHILRSKDIRELQAKYKLQKGDKFDYCITKTKTPKMKDGKKVYYSGKLQYETKRDFSNILRREELEKKKFQEAKAQTEAPIKEEKTQSQDTSDTYFIEHGGKQIEVVDIKGVIYEVTKDRSGNKIISPLNERRHSSLGGLRDAKTKTPPTTKTPKIKSEIDRGDFGRE